MYTKEIGLQGERTKARTALHYYLILISEGYNSPRSCRGKMKMIQ